MRYTAFRIQNFRGITDTTVQLSPSGASIFTLIGLNESGKTTILEAIEWFQYNDGAERALYRSNAAKTDTSSFVPKHRKATFTGDIFVEATVELTQEDIQNVANRAYDDHGLRIDISRFPTTFSIRRGESFKDGDKHEEIHHWSLDVYGRQGRQTKDRDISADTEEWQDITDYILEGLPEVVYFPTFLFDQPERIILNPTKEEGITNRIYRQIIETVGASLSEPIDIKKNIVSRINPSLRGTEPSRGIYGLSDDRRQQIDSAINHMSFSLSNNVLGTWHKIFGGQVGNKEIVLKLSVDPNGSLPSIVSLQFNIKDGVQQYNISERSLGFRWFFSFLLFTLYRPNKVRHKATLFLLDEPASNLHAAAQGQLLHSFPKIASNGSQVIYSTHSHYLINPEWLEQAFIVTNSAIEAGEDDALSHRTPANSEVSVVRYRTFVGESPDKIDYFQPVLDRLQVVPSKLDKVLPCVILEGKGDYFILAYGLWQYLQEPTPYCIVPTRGASSYSEIVGLLLGWGTNFCACFDDDTEGRSAVKDLRDEWGISDTRAFTLGALNRSLHGKAIEGLLSTTDLDLISRHYSISKKPSKKQIQLFFSEMLAKKVAVDLSSSFRENVEAFHAKIMYGLGFADHKSS